MEVYEVFGENTQAEQTSEKWQWTSEGITIGEKNISIEDIDWCKTSGGKLTLEMRDGTEIYAYYSDDEKDKIKRVKKGLRKAIDKIDNEKAQQEAKIYCEIFEDMNSYGEKMIKGKWSYEGMLIGSKMIPVEDIKDCKFVASGYTYCLLFELKNGRYERFELANEEQYEQGKRAVMMIINELNKLDSGEWQ